MAKISQKVDLTENGDFTVDDSFPLINWISPEVDDGYWGIVHQDIMTNEEFEKKCAYEEFWGKKCHDNQKSQVFYDDEKFLNHLRTHCERCGGEIRIPWNYHYGLCKRCFEVYYNNRIPWKQELLAIERDTTKEIFLLK